VDMHTGLAGSARLASWSSTVGRLIGADLDEPTGQQIAICLARAVEQASLRQVRSLRGLAR